jgi:hypothetical protein
MERLKPTACFNSTVGDIESSCRLVTTSIKAGPSYCAAMYPTLKLEILELSFVRAIVGRRKPQ